MANYLYNGVELPDIEEVWTDKETYKYAIIFNDDGILPKLFFSTLPMYVTSEGSVAMSTEGTAYWYLKGQGGNLITGVYDEWAKGATTFNGGNSGYTSEELLWSNYDVVGEDGTIYLKAYNNPIDPTSLLMGYRVGQMIRSMRSKKEPVAFLYGEDKVRLPKLPESEFLYKVITRASDGSIKLICGESTFVIRTYDNGNTSLFIDNSQNRGKGKAQMFDYVNGTWEFYHEYLACTIINGIGGFGGELIWCNESVPVVWYTDSTYDAIEYGDVYLPKSNPVPIYE